MLDLNRASCSSVFFLMDRGDRLFVNVLTWLSWMTACVCAVSLSVYRERESTLYHLLYYMYVETTAATT